RRRRAESRAWRALRRSERLPRAASFEPPPFPPTWARTRWSRSPISRAAVGCCEKKTCPHSEREQTDGVRRFSEFRGKRSQESGREALDDALDDAKAVAVRRSRLQSERGFRHGELLHDGSRGFVVGVALLEDACGGEGQFLSGAGEFLGGLLQEREIAACHATSALATNEFDAPVLAHFVAAADEQAAYLAGAADVSAAAGLEVGSGDFNGAECAFALDFLADAESRQLGAGAVANGNGAVFEDDGVGGAFSAFEDVIRGLRATQIDAGGIGAEMKRD